MIYLHVQKNHVTILGLLIVFLYISIVLVARRVAYPALCAFLHKD